MWLVLLIWGCVESDVATSGASEPLRVAEGVFTPGDLPEDPDAETPVITNVGAVNAVATQGLGTLTFNGLTSPDAWSVAVAAPDVGTGYWVLPAGAPDVTQENQLTFVATIAIGEAVPFGLQTVSFVAIGEDGAPGPRQDTALCVLPESAAGALTACEPSVQPPGAVITLSWDTDVDLDLVVVAPNGKVVRGKAPTTALVDGANPVPTTTVNDPTTGRLSRDSNADCAIDGIRRESLVFAGTPPAGDYEVYASMARHCGRPVVHFEASTHRRVEAEDGTYPVETEVIAVGALLAGQADGGAGLGTRLGTVAFP